MEKIQVDQRPEEEEEKRKWKQNDFLMVEFIWKVGGKYISQNVWIFFHNMILFGKKIGVWEWSSTIWMRGGLAKMSCQKLFSE